MHIDRFTVAGGNHVALIIAREKQEKGQLLSGRIKSVRPRSKQ